jgi:hypothetical protein
VTIVKPNTRLDIKAPGAYRALLALNDECKAATASAGLDRMLVDLVTTSGLDVSPGVASHALPVAVANSR